VLEPDGPRRRLLIAVGHTAGHVYPALAIADAYRAAFPDVDLRFAGTTDGPATRLLAARGLVLEPIESSPFGNVGTLGRLAAVPRILTGIAQARRLLAAHGSRLVIGLGSYVSGPVLLAGRSLGLRLAIHEANAVPGIANRLLAPLAHRTYLGSATVAGAFPARRRLVTGHPVRADIAELGSVPRMAPERLRAVRVLVMSGTRSAAFLAGRVPDLLAAIERRGLVIEALHQSGDQSHNEVAHEYRRAGVKATVVPYLDDIASAFRSADLLIAPSGAGVVAEAAVAGVPALYVALGDAAGDHQAANAVAAAAAGAGLAVRETEWQSETLAGCLAALLADAKAWEAMSMAARRLAVPNAAERIVVDCEALMLGRW
jgi:UDP-N-acetylglucosamine--N-acetylmuramyl-(pentapeptide) pyrophosphoryl-undecaprenol N-acetylglucosamine transferase